MQKMDNPINDEPGPEPEIIQAEVVEVEPGTPWEWQEVRRPRPQRRWRLPLLLFVVTCLSTLWVGTQIWDQQMDWLAGLAAGLRYAVPLMTILLCHEMGHFLQAHRYGVYASLPYFIPIPAPPFGTLGAVIAMEPRVGGRKALFDIGITGPLAGLVPTLIFCVLGLYLTPKAILVLEHRSQLSVGCPLLFRALCTWRFGQLPADFSINVDRLHPMAFAGWVGLFITSLNLFPIGQLDGGHVLYAILRRRAHSVATALLLAAVFLVVLDYQHLWHWTFAILFLLLIIGPFHPPTANDEEPLGAGRIVLGWLTLAFIFVGFTPIPLRP